VYLHHKPNLPFAPKLFLKNRKKKVLGYVMGAKKNIKKLKILTNPSCTVGGGQKNSKKNK
jgi:hypothetical protein